jgi:hypothetical protein
MKRLLPILALLVLPGCTMKPFGVAPWVIVMPGAKLEVVIGNKSEDKRKRQSGNTKPVPPEDGKGDEKNAGVSSVSDGFKPPNMTGD